MKKGFILTALLTASMLLVGCSDADIKKIASVILDDDSSSEPQNPTDESSNTGGEEAVTVTINKEALSLGVDESDTLVATTSIGGAAVNWSISDDTVATIDENGLVTALKAGSAIITATISGRQEKAEIELTVVSDYFIHDNTEILVQTTFNDTFGQVFKDAIAAVQKKEPHLTVKYDKYSGSYTDLKDAVIQGVPAGNYPDVVAAYPDSVADFIASGIQLKMDKYMNNADYGWSAEEKADYYPAYLEEGTKYSVSGTYSLPIAKSTEAMYYDADKIIGLNLAAVDPSINNGQAITEDYLNSLTWDEFFNKFAPALLEYRETLPSAAAKKAFLDKDTYPDWAVMGYDSDDNLFITLAEQYGYGYTSMNELTGDGTIEFVNDGMKNLMKQFNQAFKNKYFTTKGIIGTNVNYRSNEDAILFSIGSTGGVNYQFSKDNPKNIGVARVPQAAGKDVKLIQQGPSLAFLKHTDNSNNRGLGAWLFYKELTDVRSATAWATVTGYSPIRKSVAESDDFLEFSDPSNFAPKTGDRLKALNASYQEATMGYLFTSPVFKGSSEARTQVAGIVTKAVGAENLTDEKLNELFATAESNTALKM